MRSTGAFDRGSAEAAAAASDPKTMRRNTIRIVKCAHKTRFVLIISCARVSHEADGNLTKIAPFNLSVLRSEFV